MCTSFLCTALANFVPDLIVGAIFGTILAIWIGMRLTRFEQTEQRKIEKIENFERAIHYLKLINDEINEKLEEIPKLLDKLLVDLEVEQTIELMISTPFWDSIKPSGELPKLLEPVILSKITEFYEYTSFVKRVFDRFFPNTKSNVVSWSPTKSSASEGLRKAQNVGRLIPIKIENEISRLEEELETLLT